MLVGAYTRPIIANLRAVRLSRVSRIMQYLFPIVAAPLLGVRQGLVCTLAFHKLVLCIRL